MTNVRPMVLRRTRGRAATRRKLTCCNCGAEFMPSRIDAKWCSRLCQSHAWATRQNAPLGQRKIQN
jgi:hypothetical protein